MLMKIEFTIIVMTFIDLIQESIVQNRLDLAVTLCGDVS